VATSSTGIKRRREVRLCSDTLEVQAVDVLHGEVPLAVDLAEIVELHDVRVMKERGDAGLVDKHRQERRICGEPPQDSFDDEALLDALVGQGRAPDLGHAPSAEALVQGVAAEGLALSRSSGGALGGEICAEVGARLGLGRGAASSSARRRRRSLGLGGRRAG
jgi:hypothetical protein